MQGLAYAEGPRTGEHPVPIDLLAGEHLPGIQPQGASIRASCPLPPRARIEEETPLRGFGRLVGESPAMRFLYRRIERLAPTDVSALILGETGTGKELVARALHTASPRAAGPFVAVNAAAIPHELIESTLFGHEKGAFTGAREARMGVCEQAHGGTLFLDEIAEMSFEAQAKLLRFLQDHEVKRLGARRSRRLDVRVLAATNADPRRQIAARRLRADLYYRLRVVCLELPPLSERGGDVALLATHFLRRASRRHGRRFTEVAPAALALLERYPWPGNVRELENAVEEAVVLHRGARLEASMLPAEIVRVALSRVPEGRSSPVAEEPPPAEPASPSWTLRERAERERVVRCLEQAEGVPEAAARVLGVSRATIYRKIKKYGLRA